LAFESLKYGQIYINVDVESMVHRYEKVICDGHSSYIILYIFYFILNVNVRCSYYFSKSDILYYRGINTQLANKKVLMGLWRVKLVLVIIVVKNK